MRTKKNLHAVKSILNSSVRSKKSYHGHSLLMDTDGMRYWWRDVVVTLHTCLHQIEMRIKTYLEIEKKCKALGQSNKIFFYRAYANSKVRKIYKKWGGRYSIDRN